ncbi:MAG: hypothetical protein R3244_11455 [Thermoanaerobaculia bacterium]|nr:hypothetical protein [Thermoanaerobaculia bacterium]
MSRRVVVLLLTLVALGIFYLWSESSARVGAAGPEMATTTGARIAGARQRVMRVASAELDRPSAEFSLGRNLFAYGQPPRSDAPVEKKPPVKKKPEPQPEPATTTEPPKPQPPPVDVIYLGNFGRPGHRIAVFSDADAVYNAQVGDVVKEKFRLVHIGYESADLAFVGFPEAEPERLGVAGGAGS